MKGNGMCPSLVYVRLGAVLVWRASGRGLERGGWSLRINS